MISVLMPYWNRLEATNTALAAMARAYPTMDMEVVIADDGSPEPFVLDSEYPWPVRVIRLPEKSVAKNPCHPFNEAAKAAKGDVLVLTNPEILHDEPVLPRMLESLKAIGSNGYVTAACWCPDENKWHCHSSLPTLEVHGIKHPEGSGLHFCAMLHRSLWDAIGGFDPVYRDGAGYDDNDLVMKLGQHGAQFLIRDDLVVTHPKKGARTDWPDGAFQRNAGIFISKWKNPVTFVCVQVGNYEGRGAEYVNKLHDMVKRNVSAGHPGRFVCITDDASGLDDGIQVIQAPKDIHGWWVKIWMFKRGLFAKGERVIFMDLDTVIIGELDSLVGYSGDFATLRDFYYPQQIGPAIISWRVNDFSESIYDEWKAGGHPTTGHGDLWWLNRINQGRFARECDKLQNLFPGMFVSFKANCNPYPPSGAKVVCFHGQPRPHNCDAEWVKLMWKIGGGKMPIMTKETNTKASIVIENIKHSSSLDIPWLDVVPAHKGLAVIVGGGPSLKSTLHEIRALVARDAVVFALNGAAKHLLCEGIPVHHQIIIDARKENASFIVPVESYYIASTCAPEILSGLQNVTLFHPNILNILEYLPKNDKPLHLVGGGSSVGMLAPSVVYTQGYREMHLFGYDSSYKDGEHHAYPQGMNDSEVTVDVVCAGRTFKCAAWMVTQAEEFQKLALNLIELDCEIQVHGSGLIPHIAWQMMNHKEAA